MAISETMMPKANAQFRIFWLVFINQLDDGGVGFCNSIYWARAKFAIFETESLSFLCSGFVSIFFKLFSTSGHSLICI